MRKSLWILVLCFIVIGTGSVSAKTPDGKTPAEETVCDNESGAAYGLCNAYCEAMDCTDPNQHASDKGCESVKKNFEKKTGRPLPCLMTCPCPGLLQLFADIVSGAVTVTRCTFSDRLFTVVTADDERAVIDSRGGNCNANGEPPFVQLSATDQLVCRVTLRKAVEARGVMCTVAE
jgi:hypothetical protein